MFGRKKRDIDDARTMVIGLNSGSGAHEGLTLGDVRDLVYRAMTLGVPLEAPVSLTPNTRAKRLSGISVSTTDIPKPPDPSVLWPPTPAHGLAVQVSSPANGNGNGNGQNFHDGGVPEHQPHQPH